MNPIQQMDTTKESTLSSTSQVQASNKKSNKAIIIAGAVFILGIAMIIIAALVIVSGMNNQNINQNISDNTTEQTQDHGTNSKNTDVNNTDESDSSTKNTSSTTRTKLLVDVTKPWFKNIQYPEEIRNLTDDNLKEVSCTETYLYLADGTFHPDLDISKTVSVTADLIDSSSWIIRDTKSSSIEIYKCNISKDEFPKDLYIYAYCNSSCGGAIGKIYGIFWWYQGNNMVEFSNETGPYVQCNSPIGLTTDNKFYFGCEAGDGLYSAASIYKFDFNEVKRIAFEDKDDDVSSYMISN